MSINASNTANTFSPTEALRSLGTKVLGQIASTSPDKAEPNLRGMHAATSVVPENTIAKVIGPLDPKESHATDTVAGWVRAGAKKVTFGLGLGGIGIGLLLKVIGIPYLPFLCFVTGIPLLLASTLLSSGETKQKNLTLSPSEQMSAMENLASNPALLLDEQFCGQLKKEFDELHANRENLGNAEQIQKTLALEHSLRLLKSMGSNLSPTQEGNRHHIERIQNLASLAEQVLALYSNDSAGAKVVSPPKKQENPLHRYGNRSSYLQSPSVAYGVS